VAPKLLCSECARQTKYAAVVSVDCAASENFEDEGWIGSTDSYQVVQCQGCETYSFRHLNWFSEYEDRDAGMDGHTERLYPKRNSRSIKALEFLNVPSNIRRIYRESIDSCNDECFTLSAAGVRAIIEGICMDQSIADFH
jgi:hypothetical protein